METDLRQSFIKTKDPIESKYIKFIDWKYDYEINKLLNEENSFNSLNKKETFDKVINSSDDCNDLKDKIQNDLNNYFDELAPRFYKCEPIFFYKKNFLKKMISKKKIRLINSEFDLDLM